MRVRTLAALLLGLSLALVLFAGARVRAEDEGPYQFLGTIPIPGNLAGGFDISWVDSRNGRDYLADRGTASIDVINTRNDKFLYAIPLNAAGNGVVAIHKPGDEDDDDLCDRDEVWVGDANSFVEVINVRTRSIVALIPTLGKARADELAYDPLDQILVVANDRDAPPYLTFISTKTRMVLGTLSYPQATSGLEQTVWDGKTKRFYISVPATTANAKGEVDEINPLTRKVTNIIPTTCSPAGLALVGGQRLVTSCGDVISVAQLKVTTTVMNVGGDEIWYNPGDERVYFGGGLDRISVPVVDTETNTLIKTLVAGVLLPSAAMPNPALSHTTHSVAADSENNHIFVPVSHEGVKVWADPVQHDDDN